MTRKADLAWGARKGILMGGLYVALAGILYAADGGSRRFEKNGLSLGSLAAVYMLGGVSAGLILGVFRSALQERSSATGVAVLAAIPISVGMTVLTSGKLTGWTSGEWLTAALGSVLIGMLGMAVLWKDRDLL